MAATIAPMASDRTIERRRSPASQIASAASPSGRNQMKRPRVSRKEVTSCAVSSCLASMISIRARICRESFGDAADDRNLVAELDHERPEVQDDDAALRLDVRQVVVEHAQQLLVRRRERPHPELLRPRALEHAGGSAVGERPGGGGDRAGERLLIRRQPSLERGRDVHVGVERVDEREPDLIADLVVGDEIRGRVAEGLVVERLVAHVAGEQAHDREERGQDDEDPGDEHPGHRGAPDVAGESVGASGSRRTSISSRPRSATRSSSPWSAAWSVISPCSTVSTGRTSTLRPSNAKAVSSLTRPLTRIS